jgi:hypothetical protein
LQGYNAKIQPVKEHCRGAKWENTPVFWLCRGAKWFYVDVLWLCRSAKREKGWVLAHRKGAKGVAVARLGNNGDWMLVELSGGAVPEMLTPLLLNRGHL